MKCKLVMLQKEKKILTYYLQDDTLVTVDVEDAGAELGLVGSIFVGKVKNILPNIHAAFVEIQKDVICFLSLTDCRNPLVLNRSYNGKLVVGDEIAVQVVRDRIKTKDAVVSTELSLSGNYAVVSYPNTAIGYSKKMTAAEGKALKAKVHPFLHLKYGYILRTNAAEFADEKVDITPIRTEIEQLTTQMDNLLAVVKVRPPFSILHRTSEKYLNSLKNKKRNDLEKIITDDEQIYKQIEVYLKAHQPEDSGKLVYYEDAMLPLEKLLRLEGKLTEALSTKVWLKSGGYLVIEPTEALTVIDVNTGKYSAKKDKETTFMHINLEAAAEIAHQMRLRNLSGIIMIDFINLQQKENREVLLQTLKKYVTVDPIKTNVIDITALGLVEVTRKRVEPPLKELLSSDFFWVQE